MCRSESEEEEREPFDSACGISTAAATPACEKQPVSFKRTGCGLRPAWLFDAPPRKRFVRSRISAIDEDEDDDSASPPPPPFPLRNSFAGAIASCLGPRRRTMSQAVDLLLELASRLHLLGRCWGSECLPST